MYGSLFAVNRSSGELLVRGPVDYEQHREYSLVIVAHDGVGLSGVVRLTSRVRVNVRVSDVNDCAPFIVINSLTSQGLAEVHHLAVLLLLIIIIIIIAMILL